MKIASVVTSIFPFMILKNFGSITSIVYYIYENEFTFKTVYIARHVDLLILGYNLKGYLDYMEIIFNLLSVVIVYKSRFRDKRYLDVNLLISVIKSASVMPKLHYIISLYFWFLAFIIHYDTIYGKYTNAIVNILLCPPQYLLKNNLLGLQ
jgi:hypothetical protein